MEGKKVIAGVKKISPGCSLFRVIVVRKYAPSKAHAHKPYNLDRQYLQIALWRYWQTPSVQTVRHYVLNTTLRSFSHTRGIVIYRSMTQSLAITAVSLSYGILWYIVVWRSPSLLLYLAVSHLRSLASSWKEKNKKVQTHAAAVAAAPTRVFCMSPLP